MHLFGLFKKKGGTLFSQNLNNKNHYHQIKKL